MPGDKAGVSSGDIGAPAKMHNRGAVESPFITDPAEVAVLDVPQEYVRRMEDAQRVYGEHHLQYRAFSQAKNHGMMTIGIQCGWLAVGGWVISRGYRYSDPMNSLFARWVASTRGRRLTTPISCLGLVIVAVTSTQLPYDVKVAFDARRGLEEQQRFMSAAMRVREEAYREGKAASEEIKRKENEALSAFMTKG